MIELGGDGRLPRRPGQRGAATLGQYGPLGRGFRFLIGEACRLVQECEGAVSLGFKVLDSE
jgi:hypothetical protein